MGTFIENFRERFRNKEVLAQIITINVVVFILINALAIFSLLFKVNVIIVLKYLAVPSNLGELLIHPWTIITYMFTHEGLFHILFNMLVLYAFGKIFLSYFNPRSLGSLYVLGGIAGAALYIILFNTIPYYMDMGNSLMIGASASVTAILFGIAFYRPNIELSFFFLGRIKIVYIAIAIFIIDFFSLGSANNPGGHVAHIGGAVLGYIYAKQYLKGKDITGWVSKIIDSFANLFKPKKNESDINLKHWKHESEYKYNEKRQEESTEIDKILDKIKTSGYSSLSENEKKRLFDASKK